MKDRGWPGSSSAGGAHARAAETALAAHPVYGMRDEERVFRPCHGDVEETSRLVAPGRLPHVEAFLSCGYEHHACVKTLRLVHRHDVHRVGHQRLLLFLLEGYGGQKLGEVGH